MTKVSPQYIFEDFSLLKIAAKEEQGESEESCVLMNSFSAILCSWAQTGAYWERRGGRHVRMTRGSCSTTTRTNEVSKWWTTLNKWCPMSWHTPLACYKWRDERLPKGSVEVMVLCCARGMWEPEELAFLSSGSGRDLRLKTQRALALRYTCQSATHKGWECSSQTPVGRVDSFQVPTVPKSMNFFF